MDEEEDETSYGLLPSDLLDDSFELPSNLLEDSSELPSNLSEDSSELPSNLSEDSFVLPSLLNNTFKPVEKMRENSDLVKLHYTEKTLSLKKSPIEESIYDVGNREEYKNLFKRAKNSLRREAKIANKIFKQEYFVVESLVKVNEKSSQLSLPQRRLLTLPCEASINYLIQNGTSIKKIFEVIDAKVYMLCIKNLMTSHNFPAFSQIQRKLKLKIIDLSHPK